MTDEKLDQFPSSHSDLGLSEVFFPSPWSDSRTIAAVDDDALSTYNHLTTLHSSEFDKHWDARCDEFAASEELFNDRVDVEGLLKGTNRDYLITNKKVIFPNLNKGDADGDVTPHKIKVLNKRIDEIEYEYEQIKIEELRGKYVVIAPFWVPILCNTFYAAPCQAIISLSQELRRQGVLDCKFVLVISVLSCSRDQKDEFDRFFSGFPDDILAIPFEDDHSRNSLCKELYFPKVLIVDPHGNNLGGWDTELVYYGPSYFPFSQKHLSDIDKQDELLKARLNTFSYKNSLDGKGDYFDVEKFPTLTLGELFQCGQTSCLVKGVGTYML